MKRDTRKLLHDVTQAAMDIEQYTAGMTAETFRADGIIQAAVERKFEIIGEALNRIARSDPEILPQISDYQRIIGFRNIIAHGYDIVDVQVVWQAATENLPVLLREVLYLMEKE